ELLWCVIPLLAMMQGEEYARFQFVHTRNENTVVSPLDPGLARIFIAHFGPRLCESSMTAHNIETVTLPAVIIDRRYSKTSHRASGLGRSWKRAAFGLLVLPPSRWNIVLVPEVDHNDLPFQPAFGSSMRPSTFLGKNPLGYGIWKVMNFPSTKA